MVSFTSHLTRKLSSINMERPFCKHIFGFCFVFQFEIILVNLICEGDTKLNSEIQWNNHRTTEIAMPGNSSLTENPRDVNKRPDTHKLRETPWTLLDRFYGSSSLGGLSGLPSHSMMHLHSLTDCLNVRYQTEFRWFRKILLNLHTSVKIFYWPYAHWLIL